MYTAVPQILQVFLKFVYFFRKMISMSGSANGPHLLQEFNAVIIGQPYYNQSLEDSHFKFVSII